MISITAQVNTREVLFISVIKEFPSEGSATTNASGIMILLSVCQPVIPMECAASICPLSTLSMDALMYSELYAASLSDSAVKAKTIFGMKLAFNEVPYL